MGLIRSAPQKRLEGLIEFVEDGRGVAGIGTDDMNEDVFVRALLPRFGFDVEHRVFVGVEIGCFSSEDFGIVEAQFFFGCFEAIDQVGFQIALVFLGEGFYGFDIADGDGLGEVGGDFGEGVTVEFHSDFPFFIWVGGAGVQPLSCSCGRGFCKGLG